MIDLIREHLTVPNVLTALAGCRVRLTPQWFVPPKKPLKERIAISFSGGKTSAYMTKMLLDHFRQHEPDRGVLVTFANTGQEHEETLDFVHRCDQEFGFNTVWIEALVNPEKGQGTRHKVVTYETAARRGQPFEDVISKYGLPNRSYDHCTRELKLSPINSYLRSVGWVQKSFSLAVGIRADEIDRVSMRNIETRNVFYPCADAGDTKETVREWWARQSFNLNIPEHLGNCTWCWKKSNRKLLTLARSHPEIFEFPRRMEEQHEMNSPPRRDGKPREPRRFFRGQKTAIDLLLESKGDFVPFEDDKFIPFDADLDVGGGCGASCEIGADQD